MTWKCTNTPKGENKLYSDAKGVVPSLDLRFAEGKNLNDYMTGTPLVDHQRSMSGSNLSAGTFVNSSGLIETAKVNLLPYSEDINSGVWFKSNATINPDASLSPAGTLTADTLNVNNGATFSRLQRSNLGLASGVYTLSYYVKNTVDLGVNTVQVLDSSNTSYTETVLNFSSTTTPNWTRYQVVLDIGATALTDFNQLRITFRPSPSPSTGSSKVDIWGIQLEEGTTASTYIPTTTVPSAAPRFDHDPTTGESLGLLIEESRTNILLNSATLSTQSVTTSATAYTLSFYGTGTVTLSGTSTAGPLAGTGANDRVTLTFTPTAGTLTLTVTGTVSNAQLEAGSFPTSYIPTNGTALTRSADDASITGSNFSSWYNQSKGTVFIDRKYQGSGQGYYICNSSLFTFRYRLEGTSYIGSGDNSSSYNFVAPGQKSALGLSNDDVALSVDGASPLTDATFTLANMDRVFLGRHANGISILNGTIARFTYFPERLPDSSLQTMTTP